MNDSSAILKAVIRDLYDSGIIEDPENLTEKDWNIIKEGCDNVIDIHKICDVETQKNKVRDLTAKRKSLLEQINRVDLQINNLQNKNENETD